MEEEVKVIELDDGTYVVDDEITINNTKYVYLTNEADVMDFYIQKVILKDNEEYLEGIDSDEEFDMAIQAFLNKHKQELDDFE